jgi:hypothetical protein
VCVVSPQFPFFCFWLCVWRECSIVLSAVLEHVFLVCLYSLAFPFSFCVCYLLRVLLGTAELFVFSYCVCYEFHVAHAEWSVVCYACALRVFGLVYGGGGYQLGLYVRASGEGGDRAIGWVVELNLSFQSCFL